VLILREFKLFRICTYISADSKGVSGAAYVLSGLEAPGVNAVKTGIRSDVIRWL
jgi:hypothetical protein